VIDEAAIETIKITATKQPVLEVTAPTGINEAGVEELKAVATEPLPLAELRYFTNSAFEKSKVQVEEVQVSLHDQQLALFTKKKDGSNRFVGVEETNNKGDNGVKCIKNSGAGPNWGGGGKITMKYAGSRKMTVVECAAASDIAVRLNDGLKAKSTFSEKLALLEG